jgi:uncharacterized RDD family membrane protein YckC
MFQTFPTQEYGGFWIRVLAYVIDSILVSVVSCPLGFLVGLIGIAAEVDENSPQMALGNIFANVISIVVAWLYFAFMESSSWQATVGKRLLNLRVTDNDGHRLSFGRATGRYFGKILSGMICGIGFIMVAFTEKKQGLHDMLANTLVPKGFPSETIYQPPPPPDFSYRGPGYMGGP